MFPVHSLLSVILFAFAGVARGATPPGTVPVDTNDMIVTFGNLLAMNGASITITEAKDAPVIGLSKQASGASFTLFMVDLDADFLHWAQTGLSTSSTSMTVSGTTFYPLENTAGVTALQTYLTPGPPAGPAHRYTQYLMQTTNMSDLVVSQDVASAIQTRMGLNVTKLFSETGRSLVASNWWNTSRTDTTSSNSTANSSTSANNSLTNTTRNTASSHNFRDTVPLLAGLGGLAALFSLL